MKNIPFLISMEICDDDHHLKFRALTYAASEGHEKAIQLLSEDSQTDVNFVDAAGACALHHAVDENHVGVVNQLLNHPNINLEVLDTTAGDREGERLEDVAR